MDYLGFDSVSKRALYQSLAGICALGRVKFQNVDTNDGCVISQLSKNVFEVAVNLLMLDPVKLTNILTTRSIQPKGKSHDVIV